MASIESLPPDQRAVLELVLRRGRSYDEIAQLLSIDRAGVRQRALSALDALGPEAGVPPERRALITDYLLSALPPRVTEQVRERLAQSPGERAWARVIAAELEPIAARPLPEIPAAGEITPTQPPAPPPPAPPKEREAPRLPTRPAREPEARAPEAKPGRRGLRLPAGGLKLPSRPRGRKETLGPRPPVEAGRQRPPSRRGGMFVLVAGGLIVLAIILIVALGGGGKSKPNSPGSTTAAGAQTPSTSTTASTGTTGTTGSGQLIAQINLDPPSGGGARGVADVVRSGSTQGLEIVAQGLKANTKTNAYAVWLYNSPSDSHLLGFVNPAVTSNGKLRTVGTLPANASHFGQLLITLETQAKPTRPGTIVLQGRLKGLS